MHSPFIVDINEQNFREILERSAQTPILIHFWANAYPESTEILPALRQLAQQYQGAFTLALLDCQAQGPIAAQFGVQVLPTIALFINGQAVDGLGGAQSIEAIQAMLGKHLPSTEELALQQAIEEMQNGLYPQALNTLRALPVELQQRGDVKLAMADCLLEANQAEAAEQLLSSIPLEYQDNYFKGLQAKLELQKQAANSPEIQKLELDYQNDPTNHTLACELAVQYQHVGREEEALEILWNLLKTNLNLGDGGVKKTFMDILSALGQGNAISSRYRRQLYSTLY
ncbi:co-chaperone YbbN [Vibrio navarrensis]|uniref:co-chaperone YbbN n=1 Tax=Vibrio navarrensis TaxID=29495 RepID=UPI001865E4B7|nr:co-chaperone YbbN [Vibrio navarrensis]MBE3665828.1 co-chaperone YbbN [Vibrio navarrensis]MBE4579354.1 co-chaperone YbbN [Vibrio navarrensis]MBE4590328.1 co-chaperone YbbN [Vibrio navarrensis]MBE4598026.1 co-chaperone YbbN [Vibrio navarrensis]MBE4599265.1 co-chaperone YbbN [Vibrio navarrensis]